MTDATPQRIELRAELTGPDLERFILVASDLEYLSSLPRDRLLTHTEVRLAASVLRRLLIEGQIARLLRDTDAPRGFEPTVLVTSIDIVLAEWTGGTIWSAWAGGATPSKDATHTAHHKGMVLAHIKAEDWQPYGSPEAYFEAHPRQHADVAKMSLTDWMRSTSVALQTPQFGLVLVSRGAIVKYVANRKGGVHFDPRRQLNLAGRKRKREVEFHLLDHGLLRVGHLSGPEFEIASMVHAVTTSDWAAELVRVGEECVPEQMRGDPDEIKVFTGQASDGDGSGWATFTNTRRT